MTKEEIINGSEAFLLDLDGTVYLSETPIGNMTDTLRRLRRMGKRIVYLTNASLRERFGLETTNYSTVQMSTLIKAAKSRNLIKAVDENTSTRMLKYVPYWA